jgi:Ca-activated chloride channel family protein
MRILQIIITGILINFFAGQKSFAFSWDSKAAEAEKNYRAGNFAQAFENYKQAQIEDPGNEKLKYNLGNTSYKLGKFDEASNIYKSLAAGAQEKNLKEKSFYNLGNTYYRLGKLEDSEKSYMEALKLDSNDMQAKKNLEKVREEMKKRQKDEKERKDNKSKQPDKNKKGQDKPDNKNKDNKKNENNKPDNKGKDNNNNPDKKGKGSDNQPKGEKDNAGNEKQKMKMSNGVSKEEAEKWLNNVKDKSQEITRKQAQKKAIQGYRSTKDW